ncbi:DEAD-box ATP-dependent RNA helicase 22-like isoform X2 [Corylus avellana]|uniref:DEAD-box ATP-dependent RNA helicase 22-like isoform X2 n=1 Tax=Corylus avellana TaxID=13451 RepID=UPI00286CD696|nr:DEAD-box ATP-dependent RNA helicase 22-like isoform X2 [Corylus avellana]
MICLFQADFATSAVDFLHRVGRTARAGQFGLVTSLYTESNRDLVAAVCQAGDIGQPVESAFSRKRSFRNKLKKRALDKVRDLSTA